MCQLGSLQVASCETRAEQTSVVTKKFSSSDATILACRSKVNAKGHGLDRVMPFRILGPLYTGWSRKNRTNFNAI